MNHSHSKAGNATVAAIVALVIGAAVGGGVGYAAGNNMMNQGQNNSAMEQTDTQGDGTLVGGALMVRNKDIVDNAAAASNVSTTVDLVGKAGLASTLKGEGPFTVFGPNNDAFAKLPAATVADLQKPENVETLKKILTYHVVAGTYTSADLRVMAGKGETLTTVQGGILTPVVEDNMVKLRDSMNNVVEIETADVISSNGVTHVIKSVLMPS